MKALLLIILFVLSTCGFTDELTDLMECLDTLARCKRNCVHPDCHKNCGRYKCAKYLKNK